MNKQSPNQRSSRKQNERDCEHTHFSPAILEAAERSLKEFKSQVDEDFLTRAEMDRKLNSL